MSEDSAADHKETTKQNGIEMQTRTRCELEDIDEVWNTADLRCGDEVEAAIETVREDHDENVLVEDSPWILDVHWNENTNSVWIARFGYDGGMEVLES